jgi:hypothetical protein
MRRRLSRIALAFAGAMDNDRIEPKPVVRARARKAPPALSLVTALSLMMTPSTTANPAPNNSAAATTD